MIYPCSVDKISNFKTKIDDFVGVDGCGWVKTFLGGKCSYFVQKVRKLSLMTRNVKKIEVEAKNARFPIITHSENISPRMQIFPQPLVAEVKESYILKSGRIISRNSKQDVKN